MKKYLILFLFLMVSSFVIVFIKQHVSPENYFTVGLLGGMFTIQGFNILRGLLL